LFDLQDSWSKGMTLRPDLLQSRLNVEQQGIQLKFDRNQLFPEVDVIGSYGYNGTGQEYSDVFSQINAANRPFYGVGGQLTMPLSNVGPRNTYKADKVTLQQLLLKLKQFEQNVMVDIDNAVKNAQSTYESVGATRQARIYAEAAHHVHRVATPEHTHHRPRTGNPCPRQLLRSARHPGPKGRQHAGTPPYQCRGKVKVGTPRCGVRTSQRDVPTKNARHRARRPINRAENS
jgi:hypothetical protein